MPLEGLECYDQIMYGLICCCKFVELSSHEGAVQSFSWRSDGCTLASTCRDKQLRVFDVRAAAVVQVICYFVIVIIVTYVQSIKSNR